MSVLRTARGQSLVLFAGMMLFLTLMVTLTLSIAFRVRQKIELQTLADAAAYSNAVALARGLNAVSVVNRVLVATSAVAIAEQSLISWSTLVRAIGGGVVEAAPTCQAQAPAAALMAQIQALPWGDLDAAAGAAVFNMNDRQILIQGTPTIGATYTFEGGAFGPHWTDAMEKVASGQIIDAVIRESGVDDVIASLMTENVNAINTREIYTNNEICVDAPYFLPLEVVQAAMATRGRAFTARRDLEGGGNSNTLIQARIDELIAAANLTGFTVTVGTVRGSGYWAQSPVATHGQWPFNGGDWMADDDVTITLEYNGCTATADPFVLLHSAFLGKPDFHTYTGFNEPPEVEAARHGLNPDIMNGNWPLAPYYYPCLLERPNDLYGQPKTVAHVHRQSGAAPNVWELTFGWTQGGQTQNFDGSTMRAGQAGHSAFAAGLAYYHRPGDWREGPNTLNPFWRAALARIDVDARQDINRVAEPYVDGSDGSADVRGLLNVDPHVEIYEGLLQAGYEGMH